MRPMLSPLGKPLSAVLILTQVPPPSVLFQMPLTGARAVEIPGAAAAFPGSRHEYFGVVRVDDQVDGAAVVIDKQGSLPGFAAVGGFKHPMPRSALGSRGGPSTATQSVLGSLGCSTMRLMWWLSGRPRQSQVLPPSALRYMPVPAYEERLLLHSPLPSQMTLFFQSTAISPMVMAGFVVEYRFETGAVALRIPQTPRCESYRRPPHKTRKTNRARITHTPAAAENNRPMFLLNNCEKSAFLQIPAGFPQFKTFHSL